MITEVVLYSKLLQAPISHCAVGACSYRPFKAPFEMTREGSSAVLDGSKAPFEMTREREQSRAVPTTKAPWEMTRKRKQCCAHGAKDSFEMTRVGSKALLHGSKKSFEMTTEREQSSVLQATKLRSK